MFQLDQFCWFKKDNYFWVGFLTSSDMMSVAPVGGNCNLYNGNYIVDFITETTVICGEQQGERITGLYDFFLLFYPLFLFLRENRSSGFVNFCIVAQRDIPCFLLWSVSQVISNSGQGSNLQLASASHPVLEKSKNIILKVLAGWLSCV